jgi:hypothetical protein
MRTLVSCLLFVVVPRVAQACPVCFGQNDSPLASAINRGIFAMLLITAAVLVSFASFFIRLIRRAQLASESDSVEAGHYVGAARHPEGGTV